MSDKAHNSSGAIYLTDSVRALERTAQRALPGGALMERAGRAAAEHARELLGANGTRVLLVAGPGNNGGDAFVAARYLREWFFHVDVVFSGNAEQLPADAGLALEKLRASGGTLLSAFPMGKYDLIIDGLFGIGLTRPIAGQYAQLVARINAAPCPVLALDVPSGLQSDTGEVLGCAVRAHHTITFLALKPGLLTLDGPDHCGTLRCDRLGIEGQELPAPDGYVIDTKVVGAYLPARKKNSHKGSYGNIGVIGGAPGMVGAAMLAGRAALLCGAGRVFVGTQASDAPPYDTRQPELMLRAATSVVEQQDLSCIVIGPGLGQASEARALVAKALAAAIPLIIDADALNLIAADAGLRTKLGARAAPTLLTPHPAEAARLLDVSTAQVQAHRLHAALEIAQRYRCATVLKGLGSICAAPDQPWYINTTGNPGLASAGMGDVLAGILAALIGQGLSATQALLLGVHVHACAADEKTRTGVGPIGLSASEICLAARRLLNRWVARAQPANQA